MHNARRHMTVVLNVFASMDIVEMEFFIVSRIISTAMSLIIAEEMPFADTIKQLLITPAFVYRDSMEMDLPVCRNCHVKMIQIFVLITRRVYLQVISNSLASVMTATLATV